LKKQITNFLVVLSLLKIDRIMSKFEELSEAIARKNKNRNSELEAHKEEELELEVAGTELTNVPLLSCGDDENDMDHIDQLYFKPKHKPLMGEFAEKWD
jgi:hypothetical protein